MQDHALALAFPRIAEAIVHITVERDNAETGKSTYASGTGTIVGFTSRGRRPLIATARHVIPTNLDDGELMSVTVRRAEIAGQPPRLQRFRAQKGESLNDVVWTTSRSEDIGALILPASDESGALLIDDDRPPTVVWDNAVPAPATRVAWAGYPFLIKEEFGADQLCYFEGVVSALLSKPNAILVDGHALPGVSGGPLWFYDDRTGAASIAGLVSAYMGHRLPQEFHPDHPSSARDARRDRMPGFCVIQPIYPLTQWVMSWAKHRIVR